MARRSVHAAPPVCYSAADMSGPAESEQLLARDMKAILDVATALAAPFDLKTMLAEVIGAAKQVLGAERGSVWLYDAAADELTLEIATGLRTLRVPAGAGLVGSCARHRQLINVPDCYADPRFDREVDKSSGYRTRCMLTLPLVDHKGVLVGVMQVLNKRDGVFDSKDEAMAVALAAQCAVALSRVRMTEALIEGEKMRQELEMARVVQMSTLPSTMPAIDGYCVYGAFEPAELTGGDTFDLSKVDGELLVILADATGHGIAPALLVTQMQAMLRVAFRLGATLETAVVQVNNQLADWLAADRFVTAFIGLLEPTAHELRFHSAGQAPILHFRAASEDCTLHKPTSFPLGAMRLASLRPAVVLDMQPGDIVVLLSDGIYEYQDADGAEFGVDRVREIVLAHHWRPVAELGRMIVESARAFARGAAQQDDITVVLVKREPVETAYGRFRRSVDALDDVVAFTDEFLRRERVDPSLKPGIDFALEELFTNMVKYGGSTSPVRIDLARIAGGAQATLTDYDVDRFDVTGSPDADVDVPIEQRTIGGLGLHLTRRIVDTLEYEYSEPERRSRITFRKCRAGDPDSGADTPPGGSDARD
jgi:phosphoserine phosphatase